jgi:hypothetical protein
MKLQRIVLIAILALLFPFIPSSRAVSQAAASNIPNSAAASPVLRIDPLLIAEAHEAWSLIGADNNPVWPGWNASSTPMLFYLPGVQDVLINHPHPPQGFRLYSGPVAFPGWNIYIKDGPTIIGMDGQNTSTEVDGVPTLVVADTLSNMRQSVFGMVADPRPPQEKFQTINFQSLATDPYDQIAMVVHENFHVYQDKMAPDKGASEMLLLYYPVLSVQNNVDFALEGQALADAMRLTDAAQFRHAAVCWLALRKERRALLPPKAIEYEDGVEFTEGTAKYTEYRLFQVLEGRKPGAAMNWVQGFAGYDDLAPQRRQLIDRMIQNMSGAVSVNNDPYGTAPLRMRLYYSGMAMGVLLDRLMPGWQKRIFAADASLTSLLEEALKATPEELDSALKDEKSKPGYAELVKAKNKLADEGKAHSEAMAKEIEQGPGVGLIVDYSQLVDPKVRMAFTPFGITVIDAQRTIFTQIPVQVKFGQQGELAQTAPAPLLQDKGHKLVRFRLPHNAIRAEVEKIVEPILASGPTVTGLNLELPGVTVKAAKAQLRWSGNDLTIVLMEPGKDAPK